MSKYTHLHVQVQMLDTEREKHDQHGCCDVRTQTETETQTLKLNRWETANLLLLLHPKELHLGTGKKFSVELKQQI